MPSVADLTLQQSSLYMLQHAFSSRLDAALYYSMPSVADLTLHAVCLNKFFMPSVADLTPCSMSVYALYAFSSRLNAAAEQFVYVNFVCLQ